MEQIKDMTTAEWRKAWTEIAIAFETIRAQRDKKQLCITYSGLCGAMAMSRRVCYPSLELCRFAGGDDPNEAWYPFWDEDEYFDVIDLYRATHAAMFAAMTPKEFLEICEAPR